LQGNHQPKRAETGVIRANAADREGRVVRKSGIQVNSRITITANRLRIIIANKGIMYLFAPLRTRNSSIPHIHPQNRLTAIMPVIKNTIRLTVFIKAEGRTARGWIARSSPSVSRL